MTDGNPRRIIITDFLDHMQKKKHGKAGKAGVGGLTRKKPQSLIDHIAPG
jgi:hypothetical protein